MNRIKAFFAKRWENLCTGFKYGFIRRLHAENQIVREQDPVAQQLDDRTAWIRRYRLRNPSVDFYSAAVVYNRVFNGHPNTPEGRAARIKELSQVLFDKQVESGRRIREQRRTNKEALNDYPAKFLGYKKDWIEMYVADNPGLSESDVDAKFYELALGFPIRSVKPPRHPELGGIYASEPDPRKNGAAWQRWCETTFHWIDSVHVIHALHYQRIQYYNQILPLNFVEPDKS